MTDEHRKRLIDAGQEILRRAMLAKERGQIADYSIFVREDDPAIIDHITLHKHP